MRFEQKRESWSEADVDGIVTRTFFGETSEQDHNLQFVRDMLIKRAPDATSALATYQEIRLGRHPIRDEEQSLVKTHLKLSGIVRREQDTLRVRNPIYAEVFDQRWVQAHWPSHWIKRIPPAVFGLIASLLVLWRCWRCLRGHSNSSPNSSKRQRGRPRRLQKSNNAYVLSPSLRLLLPQGTAQTR